MIEFKNICINSSYIQIYKPGVLNYNFESFFFTWYKKVQSWKKIEIQINFNIGSLECIWQTQLQLVNWQIHWPSNIKLTNHPIHLCSLKWELSTYLCSNTGTYPFHENKNRRKEEKKLIDRWNLKRWRR